MTPLERRRTWRASQPSRLLCDWHRKGVPAGAARRFFVDGCPMCLKKLAAGLCERTDPTPRQIWLQHAKRNSRIEFTGGRAHVEIND